MTNLISMEKPDIENSYMSPKEIYMKNKRFAKISTISHIYDVSKSTVYRWLENLDEQQFPGVYVELSSSLKLINLDEFDKYLYSMHKKYL